MYREQAAGLASIGTAVEAIGAGGMAIVVDDPGRENEGDLVIAAQFATPERINFMMTHGRGLICTPVVAGRLEELGVPPMVERSSDPRGTAFHVSVDLASSRTGGDRCMAVSNVVALYDSSPLGRLARNEGPTQGGCRPAEGPRAATSPP